MLQAWAQERAHSVKMAAALTGLNGQLCNYGDSWKLWLLRNIDWAIRQVPLFRELPDPFARGEARGFTAVDGGFFSQEHGGGGRLPQVYLSSQRTGGPVLSDFVLRPQSTVMTLMVIAGDSPAHDAAEARRAIEEAQIDGSILGHDSIKVICPTPYAGAGGDLELYHPTTMQELNGAGVHVRPLYAPENLFSRFMPSTKFVILREDFFAFGLARDYLELVECISHLKHRIN